MEEEVVASAAKERTDEGRQWGLQAWDSQKILLGTSRDVFAGAAAAASVGAAGTGTAPGWAWACAMRARGALLQALAAAKGRGKRRATWRRGPCHRTRI